MGPFVFFIWIMCIIFFVANAAKKSGAARKNPQRPVQQRPPQQSPQVYDAQQQALDSMHAANRPRQLSQNSTSQSGSAWPWKVDPNKPNFRNSPPYGTQPVRAYTPGQNRSSQFGATKASRLAETGVLLEDRKNDWLAKQLREEAAIYRRGSVYDLGAVHNVDCEADSIKRAHARRHNSNGLDRQTFR